MNENKTPGVLTIVHAAWKAYREAASFAAEQISTLPIIFRNADRDGISNRDTDHWGVSEGTVRRYRVVADILELDNDEQFPVQDIPTAVHAGFDGRLDGTKVKGIALSTADFRAVVNDSDTVTEAVQGIYALLDGRKVEKDIEATDVVEGEESEVEGEGEGDKVTEKMSRWLTSPMGSLNKVLEAVKNGYRFNEDEQVKFNALVEVVSGIAGAHAFAPESVEAAA